MKAPQLVVQGLDNGATIVNLIKDIAKKEKYKRVTGVFAYATDAGVKLLLNALKENMTGWHQIEKRWVVSIDYARTEPEAFKKLLSLNNSVVRVPSFEAIMKKKDFKPKRNFHPKTILFDSNNGIEAGPVGLVVGSGNLSLSGMSLGFESAMAINWSKRSSKKYKSNFREIAKEIHSIEEIFSIATPITVSMINEYRNKRPIIKQKFDDDSDEISDITQENSELDISKAIALRTSRHFWIDVAYVAPNRGKGIPGNQIDMQRGSRTFFGFSPETIKRNAPLGDVNIRYNDAPVTCHMRFGNNFMDKLNLPIPGADGPETYENKTLMFEKLRDGTYSLTIGSKAGISKWKRLSKKTKTLYQMQSGREYGVF